MIIAVVPFSVADPDPNPLNPLFFWVSGSFYHQAKIVGKPLIPTVLLLIFDFFIFENDVNVPLKSNKLENIFLN